MIKFFNLPVNEAARDQLVEEMTAVGYEGEEANRLADAACAIVIAVLRDLDSKVERESSDDNDQTVIQQIVFHQLVGIFHESMRLNAISHLMKGLSRLFR